ncbi:hypothetical protein ACET3Z_027838 [Daucus carota]
MVILTVKLLDLYAVRLTMEVVGRKPRMAGLILLALTTIPKVASVHQGSRVTELIIVKILMNAKQKQHVNARNCKCKNTWGSYDCSCSGNLLYMREHDT